MNSSTLLTALGFQQRQEKKSFWDLVFSNGDRLSYCTEDKSWGGSFGGIGWDKNEYRLNCVRAVLEELKP